VNLQTIDHVDCFIHVRKQLPLLADGLVETDETVCSDAAVLCRGKRHLPFGNDECSQQRRHACNLVIGGRIRVQQGVELFRRPGDVVDQPRAILRNQRLCHRKLFQDAIEMLLCGLHLLAGIERHLHIDAQFAHQIGKRLVGEGVVDAVPWRRFPCR
jgi:hypothetical protein